MATLARILLRPLALLLALVQNEVAAPPSSPPPQPTPPPHLDVRNMSAFLKRLKEDPGLRARFASNPGAAFHEAGIDPSLFELPATLDEAAIERFLGAWSGPAGPSMGASAPVTHAPQMVATIAPAVVYGPPPAPVSHRPEVAPATPRQNGGGDDPPDPVPIPPPPAPVYGPPPGLPKP